MNDVIRLKTNGSLSSIQLDDETICVQFQNYLSSVLKNNGVDDHAIPKLIDKYTVILQNSLPEFIRSCKMIPEFDSMFKTIDVIFLDDLVNIIRGNTYMDYLAREKMKGKCFETIELYRQFCSSLDVDKVKQKEEVFTEGEIISMHYDKHERSRKLRKACLALYNNEYKCVICGFNFSKVYGVRGKDFIEVHHLNPIGETDGSYEVNPDKLIPVCSNCHSMIHRFKPYLDKDGLKEILNKDYSAFMDKME